MQDGRKTTSKATGEAADYSSILILTFHVRGPTPDVVANIAQRIQRDLSATYCICESGVAGPTGGRNKPPGYVALAIASANTVTTKEVETGLSNREDNMVRFAGEAFKFFLDVLSDTSSEN